MNKIVEIAQLGDPVLRQQAQKVEDVTSPDMVEIMDSMLQTLSETNGVGLAAPQISISLRIVIIASRPSKRYPLAPKMEPVIMFNPEFEILSEATHKDWEGCLSIPGIRALVPRYSKIKIAYTDRQGNAQKLIADDFIARIFQHEYDHLNGLVYLDRVEDNRDIIAESEFQELMA
ncbi:MAG: peptide deformylase [Methylococcales symbiont of Iophon sp. n. MRB-2018]|nr:MAG: peptide deformylase [Methylococcales symbiont of Iophon sp. n. MRB-2018]KAF3980054.1 MAG: peptide deformylase [Methylococcales symbiont of Iophon sp. n. MRB-2018]